MAQGQEFRATANFTYSATTKLDIARIAAGNAAGKPGVRLRGLIVTSNLTTATPQRVQLGYCANANKATSMTANTPVATRQNAASVIAPQSTVTTWASGQTDATSVSWWRDEDADLRAGPAGTCSTAPSRARTCPRPAVWWSRSATGPDRAAARKSASR